MGVISDKSDRVKLMINHHSAIRNDDKGIGPR